MYSSEDLERFYFQYQTEALPHGESIQSFCVKNKVPYNIFSKWYKDTRKQLVEVKVDGIPCKQSFRAVLCTLIYISTFVPNLNFGQDEHKRRRQVLCLNGSQIPNRVQEQEPSRFL